MTKTPRATIHVRGDNYTIWFVQWPSTHYKWGKSYYATTYPNSDLIYLETAAKRRHVAELTASKIMPQIRSAIAKAEAA